MNYNFDYYVKQAPLGLNSRTEVDIFKENKLPIITAPMYSVLDDTEFGLDFFDRLIGLKVNVCQPRYVNHNKYDSNEYISVNLDFMEKLTKNHDDSYEGKKICIDVANGNMPRLHHLIKLVKTHYENITLMAGNVSSVEAFLQLESTGVDAIRVGIGGGNNCTTTVNTGVGQADLFKLINDCYLASKTNVKIIADGVSAFTRVLPHDDYAQYRTIILLLYAGADMVMLGTAFARMEDSKVGDLFYKNINNLSKNDGVGDYVLYDKNSTKILKPQLYKQTYGMSTKQMQALYSDKLKTSEGMSKMISLDYSSTDWVFGATDERHDKVGGFVNYLRSAMSYAGCRTLDEFIGAWSVK